MDKQLWPLRPSESCTEEQSDDSLQWWKTAVFYQIAPLSFQDLNGDGRGELGGVLRRLDYLEWLGVDAIWLCPIYPSPYLDFGYDIADFTAVAPEMGTMAEFDTLLACLHEREMRLILDFVPNHTSDRHPWFVESRSSRESPKRDWYVWRDAGPDGGPPNNWLGRFGGSAWQWDEATGQYYYHAFLKEQPDLNWHNPEVRAAMHDALRFWLARGVDGFRIDAGGVLAEDELLRDEPPNPKADESPPPEANLRRFSDNRPEAVEYLKALRAVLDEFDDRVFLGEVQTTDGRMAEFYGSDRPCLHLPLNYLLLDVPWDCASVGAAVDRYLNDVPRGDWPNWMLGSHDKRRIASRIGEEQARVAAMLAFTLPGTPIFYAGDELAMPSVDVPEKAKQDPFGKLVPGYGLSRDPERAPMRWDNSPNAGFTVGKPWLPLGDFEGHTVEDQQGDAKSHLALIRTLIALRKNTPAIRSGAYRPLREQGEILLFERCTRSTHYLIALNVAGDARDVILPGHGELVLSTKLDREHEAGRTIACRPNEGLILRLEPC
jgi:alpha-glucosidase